MPVDSVTVRVREARRADVEGIAALDALRAADTKPGYWAQVLSAYGEDGPKEGRVALVAADADERVAGFLFGEIRAWEFGSEPCGWIFTVAVCPEQERRGLATRLCDEAVERFRDMGVGVVRTMVRRDAVPLLALFRSMGFVAGPFTEMEMAISAAVPAGEEHA